MAKFRFKLESLLKLREGAEREHQQIVAKLERERVRIEDRLRRHQANITSGKQDLAGHMTGAVDVREIRQFAHVTRQVEQHAQRTAIELAGVYRRIEAARRGLAEAMRERRVIELLKERRYAAFLQAIEKDEAAALDELATNDAPRRRREAW